MAEFYTIPERMEAMIHRSAVKSGLREIWQNAVALGYEPPTEKEEFARAGRGISDAVGRLLGKQQEVVFVEQPEGLPLAGSEKIAGSCAAGICGLPSAGLPCEWELRLGSGGLGTKNFNLQEIVREEYGVVGCTYLLSLLPTGGLRAHYFSHSRAGRMINVAKNPYHLKPLSTMVVHLAQELKTMQQEQISE
jgi:hypothetical protein